MHSFYKPEYTSKTLFVANSTSSPVNLFFRIDGYTSNGEKVSRKDMRQYLIKPQQQMPVLWGKDLHPDFEKMSPSDLANTENFKMVLEEFKMFGMCENGKKYEGKGIPSGLIYSFGKPCESKEIDRAHEKVSDLQDVEAEKNLGAIVDRQKEKAEKVGLISTDEELPLSVLPSDSPYLEWAYNQAVAIVLRMPVSSIRYVLAVYNLGMHILLGIAQDINEDNNVIIDPPATLGVQAIAKAIVNQSGNINEFLILNKGQNYLTNPLMIISPPPNGGVLATALVIVQNGVVVNFEITNPGTKYIVNNFWNELRKKYNVGNIITGVTNSAGDQGTSASSTVPEFFNKLNLSSLEQIQDQWGRYYLAYAQKYGTDVLVVA